RVDELRVAARSDRRLRGEQSDPPVARRLDGRVRLGRDHADDRDHQPLLELRQRRRGRRVAGCDDQLHPLALEVAGDLTRVAADLVERAGAVGQARKVSEVEEIIVRHRHEALVENGQPPGARVENADRSWIHVRDCRLTPVPGRVWRNTVLLALILLTLAAPGTASAFTKTDLTIQMSDGVRI